MSHLYPLQLEKVSAKKVSDFILEQLEEAIILKELMSGEQLPTERELSDMLKVSRLAVREALSQLEHKGLVERRLGAKGGTFVLPVTTHAHRRTRAEVRNDWQKILQLAEFRMVIEPEAARLAAERMTPQQLLELESYWLKSREADCPRELFRALDVKFHLLIARASGNLYLERSVRRIRTRLNRALDLMPYDKDVRTDNIEHHRKLLEALRTRNSQAAFTYMQEHLAHSLASIQTRVFDDSQEDEGKGEPHEI